MYKEILKNRINPMLSMTGVLVRCFSTQRFAAENFGITPEQYLILSLLIDSKELYQRQIAEITLKDRANVARIVNTLKEKELIEKITDSNGRRIFKIVLTQKGLDLCNKIIPFAKEIRNETTKNITAEELKITLNTLEKINTNLRDKVKLQI